ncbi:uncharacterized protein LOC107878073 isoform X4 [Capsicum annuum]|uniref:uncharacterized protein LOC107878073 isoform X4 n=1 Tax=Capsicum annuum TaxID=4072 RepID=UPI0007BF071B|nr:uncharacterized protein LOC107878073 isoform X4 [Capsicum annuum]
MTATYSVPPNKESTKPKEKMGLVSRRRLVVSDFIMSFMWVWSSVLIKMFVHTILGYGAHDLKGDILKHAISVINMFFFAFLVKATKGGAYNPLTILSGAISGDLTNFIFTVAARIPAQILLEAETNSIKSSRCFSFNATGTVQRSRKAKTKLPVISHKSPQSRLPLPEQNYPLQDRATGRYYCKGDLKMNSTCFYPREDLIGVLQIKHKHFLCLNLLLMFGIIV